MVRSLIGVRLDVTYRIDGRHIITVVASTEVGHDVLAGEDLASEITQLRMCPAATPEVAGQRGSDAGSLTTERYLNVNQEDR